MEELAVVVDSNVIFAALVREQGLNRYVITILPTIIPFYYPHKLKEEILKHASEISRKSKHPVKEILTILKETLDSMKEVNIQNTELLKRAETLVSDPGDTPFVATAIKLRENFKHVIILTWNTRDYKEDQLEKEDIYIGTPEDLMKALKLHYERHENIEKITTGKITKKIYKILMSVHKEKEQPNE